MSHVFACFDRGVHVRCHLQNSQLEHQYHGWSKSPVMGPNVLKPENRVKKKFPLRPLQLFNSKICWNIIMEFLTNGLGLVLLTNKTVTYPSWLMWYLKDFWMLSILTNKQKKPIKSNQICVTTGINPSIIQNSETVFEDVLKKRIITFCWIKVLIIIYFPMGLWWLSKDKSCGQLQRLHHSYL